MSAKTTKTTTSRVPRKPPAKTSRSPKKGGNLKPESRSKLTLIALDAYKIHQPDESFDDWRRAQVKACCGAPGVSALYHYQWKKVAAHFLNLAGKADEAYKLLNTTGKKSYRPKGPDDTFETCEAYVHHIREALKNHLDTDLPEGVHHIQEEWFLHAARQRTQKPTLEMDTLADRLDPSTLRGLLSHLRNHISRREGREDSTKRAPRQYPKKPDPGEMDEIPY